MKKTLIISAFPGTGKSYIFENHNSHKVVLDSDSSKFPKDNFPQNYISHIKENIGKADVIFVSSHDVVRKALENNGIRYLLAFPDRSLKEEYIERYRVRGNNDSFISMIETMWDDFINEMENEIFPSKFVMSSKQYLSDCPQLMDHFLL